MLPHQYTMPCINIVSVLAMEVAKFLEVNSEEQNPMEWGWKKFEPGSIIHYEPVWTTLPPMKHGFTALVKYGCKLPCINVRNCRCRKADLSCSEVCECGGDCVGDALRVSS